MSDDLAALSNFGGTARLFPLPNLVFFPYVIQPLHIFEPRYRQMTADALAGDRLIAMALLRPGWDEDYLERPAIYDVVCLGRIIAAQQLPDGRYNLLLRGLSRARVLHEPPTDKLYRLAQVELLHDVAPAQADEAALRAQLAELLPAWFPAEGPVAEQFHRLIDGNLPLGTLCDVFTFALPLPFEFKQRQLEELDVRQRVRRLFDQLKEQTPPAGGLDPGRKFPPEFSSN